MDYNEPTVRLESKARNGPAPEEVEASAPAVSTSQLANHSQTRGSAYPSINLPLPAIGKFTASSAEMIELLSKRTDNEIDTIAKQADSAELQSVQLSFYGRCATDVPGFSGQCYRISRVSPGKSTRRKIGPRTSVGEAGHF